MGRLSNEFGEFNQGYSNMFRNSDGTWNNTFNPNYTWDDTKGFVANPSVGNAGNTGGFFSGLNFSDILSAGTGILQGLAGLRQAQIAEKQLGLAKQQFGFQKGLANRNIANQAKMINNQYDNAAQVAAGMIGSSNADGTYGTTDQATINQYANNAKTKHVDGSAVG